MAAKKKRVMKPVHRPRVKHKEFALTQFRLVGDDWIIIVYCPTNRQSCLFLAEPQFVAGKKTPASYFVSALERAGEKTSISGLPRMFKTADDAAEWLEMKVYKSKGSQFAEAG